MTYQTDFAKKFHLQMGQKQTYPLVAYQYDVILGGYLTSFSKITGLVLQSAEVMAINEGGRNQPYLFRDSKKKLQTMVLEKGYGTLNLIDICDKVTDVTIILRNQKGEIMQAYSTGYAVVQEIKFSELNACSTQVLIQYMSIAYTVLCESKDVAESCRNLEKNSVSENITSDIAVAQNKKSTDNMKMQKNNKINTNNMLNDIKQQNKKALQKQQELELKQKNNQNDITKNIDFSA